MLNEKNKDILKVKIINIEINNIERNSGNIKIKIDALLTTNDP